MWHINFRETSNSSRIFPDAQVKKGGKLGLGTKWAADKLDTPNPTGVFGAPLAEVLGKPSCKLDVPLVAEKCISFLEGYASRGVAAYESP